MSEPIRDDGGLLWLGLAGGLGLAIGGVALALRTMQGGDNMAKKTNILGPVWPIPANRLRKVGDSVMARRPGSGRPHKGVDLMAEAGTPVLSAAYGRVLRIVDGRGADRVKQEGLWRAGLFVDVLGLDKRIYRYLHLGSYSVKEGQPLRAGEPIGTVSPSGQSGVEHSGPHVHFEIRAGDWDRRAGDYGEPVDPLKVLPPRERVA